LTELKNGFAEPATCADPNYRAAQFTVRCTRTEDTGLMNTISAVTANKGEIAYLEIARAFYYLHHLRAAINSNVSLPRQDTVREIPQGKAALVMSYNPVIWPNYDGFAGLSAVINIAWWWKSGMDAGKRAPTSASGETGCSASCKFPPYININTNIMCN
jgi:hypothetical protein